MAKTNPLRRYVKLETEKTLAAQRVYELDKELEEVQKQKDAIMDAVAARGGLVTWTKKDAAKFRALKRKIQSIDEKMKQNIEKYTIAHEKLKAIKRKMER